MVLTRPRDTLVSVEADGPAGWRNWRAYEEGKPALERVEVVLYSDARVTGEITEGVGPYRFLNALSPFNALGPAVVVRADIAIPSPTMPEQTDESRYHGGGIFDELAALLSLALVIRCRSGGYVRTWALGDDPMGRPVHFGQPPYLPSPGNRGAVIPALENRQVNLEDSSPLLKRYASCGDAEAIGIVRAARHYQQAVWIADTDPTQAWIQFVSALEVAAEQWKVPKSTPLDRLRQAWPELAGVLEAQGEEHAAAVARIIVPLVRAKVRFLDFMKHFLPYPPGQRPHPSIQVSWDNMPTYLATIYDYRSRALHAGIPFPAPMSETPHIFDDGIQAERPLGLATSSDDASWTTADTPMLLATFEDITRRTLHAWWMQSL